MIRRTPMWVHSQWRTLSPANVVRTSYRMGDDAPYDLAVPMPPESGAWVTLSETSLPGGAPYTRADLWVPAAAYDYWVLRSLDAQVDLGRVIGPWVLARYVGRETMEAVLRELARAGEGVVGAALYACVPPQVLAVLRTGGASAEAVLLAAFTEDVTARP